MEDGRVATTVAGTPQGGVISPLLSNIYLHVLDPVWTRRYTHLGVLVRYAALSSTNLGDEVILLLQPAHGW